MTYPIKFTAGARAFITSRHLSFDEVEGRIRADIAGLGLPMTSIFPLDEGVFMNVSLVGDLQLIASPADDGTTMWVDLVLIVELEGPDGRVMPIPLPRELALRLGL